MKSSLASTLLFLLLLTTLCIGCKATLTRSNAADIIKSTKNFNSKLVLMLKTEEGVGWDHNCNGVVNRSPLWRALRELGLIDVRLRQATPGGAFTIALFSCDLIFTKQGNQESSQWTKVRQPWGTEWEIPIANRELIAVTGLIEGNPEGKVVQAEFSWKWVPNNIGQKLQMVDAQTYTSSALFRLYDDGWRLANIDISPNDIVKPL